MKCPKKIRKKFERAGIPCESAQKSTSTTLPIIVASMAVTVDVGIE